MRVRNVPIIDRRYWIAIILASVLGTSFGDFVSNTLQLGFAGAALAVGSVLAVVFVAERALPWRSVAWYWGAVVFTRTAATDIGDMFTHERGLDFGNGPIAAILAAVLVIYLFAWWRAYGPGPLSSSYEGGPKPLPKTDGRYWVTMLLISTFGTTFGDFVADDMGFGLARGSLILGILLAFALYFEISTKRSTELRYWGLIALVRTACTVIADYITEADGLKLGFEVCAGIIAASLIAVLLASQRAPLPNEPEAGADQA
jgi:uncharacterized membrane-anchored protein